ncbi:Phosphate-specific transport system accessory protein PhoU [Halorhabdus tiamatea SARL4B]|uniref:Phosphate-specific transport system accessory protein PhoU n=1 Tax=Halorhabdus tiamatea SARL4B TaxID=1033806 RepID=F7PM92_9EURY|nr:phosphate signaling complex protein PhoU [Halorhabdus tiamatea]ERJ05503.1 Phosphate-specific transport system accessory protein PhoU [Halorhabdus tiamatea SARL4B]CCQ32906.1 phosphate transport system regulatory protein PhoU [Halorhabdus tiamatea SARL4B]
MPREGYQEKLDELQEDVLYMSEVVFDRLRTGLDALEKKDDELAREVIEGDDEINQLYLDLERECVNLLALQQPVAGDLRFIAASFKIITDLERVADLAVNLGEYAIEAEQELALDVDVQAIGEAVVEMNEQAMTAYTERDGDLCYAIGDRDDEVDAMCQDASDTVMRGLIEREIDEETSEEEIESLMRDVSRLLLTIRDLERVGDHAVNIAARTLYMVDNDDALIY